jgi:hypothetical protein
LTSKKLDTRRKPSHHQHIPAWHLLFHVEETFQIHGPQSLEGPFLTTRN